MLQVNLEYTCDIVKKMSQEHQDYMMTRQIDPKVEQRRNLTTFVEMDIQKPVKGSKYGLLLPEQLEECYIHKHLTEEL